MMKNNQLTPMLNEVFHLIYAQLEEYDQLKISQLFFSTEEIV